jgi:hypothetical protein
MNRKKLGEINMGTVESFCMTKEQKDDLVSFLDFIAEELKNQISDFERGKLHERIKAFSRKACSKSNYKIIKEGAHIDETSSNSK